MPLSDIETNLRHVIAARKSRLRADLEAHVAIPTGQNHVAGLADYRAMLVERLESLAATSELVAGAKRPDWLTLPAHAMDSTHDAEEAIPPTAILRGPHRKRSSPRILLAGHLDTVHDPAGPFQRLTVSTDQRTAAGPGAADMKGGIVVALHALEALAECGVETNWTFLLNSDEETGSFHSFDALTAAAREHDVGIALEPALPDGSLVVERMGAGQFKVEVFGRAAHVGREFSRGSSAVTRLAEIIIELQKLSDPDRGLIVNVGPLIGGQVTNIVPDYAACWGNVRFADDSSRATLQQSFEKLQSESSAIPRVVVHTAFNRPAKPIIEPVKQLAEAARATATDLGQQLPFGKTGGVCDGNILQAAGLPTLDTLGVRGGNLHRTDEYIELPSLVERCELLAVLISRLASGAIRIGG